MERLVPKATVCALLLFSPRIAREEQVVHFGPPNVAATHPISDPDGVASPDSAPLLQVGLGLGLLAIGALRKRHQH